MKGLKENITAGQFINKYPHLTKAEIYKLMNYRYNSIRCRTMSKVMQKNCESFIGYYSTKKVFELFRIPDDTLLIFDKTNLPDQLIVINTLPLDISSLTDLIHISRKRMQNTQEIRDMFIQSNINPYSQETQKIYLGLDILKDFFQIPNIAILPRD